MRTIKFRAWVKDERKMISADSFAFEDYQPLAYLFKSSELVFMQFTGLLDKNGNEIYEGDITALRISLIEVRHFEVAIKSVVRAVQNYHSFTDGFSKVRITGVVFKWKGFELFPILNIDGTDDTSKMEVIGNIHDNPELMK